MKQSVPAGVPQVMHAKRLPVLLLVGMGLGLSACTFPSSGRTLPASQVGQLQKRTLGTVIAVTEVMIEGQKTNLGQYGGAVIGGAAALPNGGVGGRGDVLVVAGASIVGALAGQAVEEYATRKRAQEVTVEMANGDVFVIVQEAPPDYQVGDKVHVIHGPNGARLEMALDFDRPTAWPRVP